MFMLPTKTLIKEALDKVFGDQYPVLEFRKIQTTLEFPATQQDYPAIWIDFTPTTPLQSAGIGHTEMVIDADGGQHIGTRWRFGGQITFTCASLSSIQRDALVDEMVRVLAFGREHPTLSLFRLTLENNDLIDIAGQWDTFSLTGSNESVGTPWGTDDVIYEMTVAMDCQGSFVSENTNVRGFLPLSQIIIRGYPEGGDQPDFSATSPPNATPGPNQWM